MSNFRDQEYLSRSDELHVERLRLWGGNLNPKIQASTEKKNVSLNTLRRSYAQFYMLLEYHSFHSWRGPPLEFTILPLTLLTSKVAFLLSFLFLQFSYDKLNLFISVQLIWVQKC